MRTARRMVPPRTPATRATCQWPSSKIASMTTRCTACASAEWARLDGARAEGHTTEVHLPPCISPPAGSAAIRFAGSGTGAWWRNGRTTCKEKGYETANRFPGDVRGGGRSGAVPGRTSGRHVSESPSVGEQLLRDGGRRGAALQRERQGSDLPPGPSSRPAVGEKRLRRTLHAVQVHQRRLSLPRQAPSARRLPREMCS
jgi:hypothetical protein